MWWIWVLVFAGVLLVVEIVRWHDLVVAKARGYLG